MRDNGILFRLIRLIVLVLTPLVTLMIAVRLLITPAFVQFEYRLPNFPDDHYGFTIEERLRWSKPSVNYLVNKENISFLSSLVFDSGQPIFNDQELSHMEDVKAVVTGMQGALAISVIILMTVSLITIHLGGKEMLLRSYYWAGWLIIGLIVSILVFVIFNFNSLFTWFHQIFFESGTWQFDPADTLIRLFPMRFWQDAFTFVGMLSLLIGSLLLWFSKINRFMR